MVTQKFNLKSKCVMVMVWWVHGCSWWFLFLVFTAKRAGALAVVLKKAQVRYRAVLKSLPYAFHQVHRAFQTQSRRTKQKAQQMDSTITIQSKCISLELWLCWSIVYCQLSVRQTQLPYRCPCQADSPSLISKILKNLVRRPAQNDVFFIISHDIPRIRPLPTMCGEQ